MCQKFTFLNSMFYTLYITFPRTICKTVHLNISISRGMFKTHQINENHSLLSGVANKPKVYTGNEETGNHDNGLDRIYFYIFENPSSQNK